jgi:serine/threonine-protein kinase
MPSSTPSHADDTAGLVRVGEVLADKYRVERVLGVGGMGLVVAATHLQLDEPVAIKLMLPEAAKSPEAAQRFLREAKAARKIRSEHVARVEDVGTLSSGTPYMVMEYLVGSDLADLLVAKGQMPVTQAVEYVLQACEALAEAHAAGFVHRDLKPANLFLTHHADGSPCVKLLDFGISKIISGAPEAKMTKTSAVMGSPLYMSPEQLRSSRDVDARADLWALGAVLHELLTGAPPFDADTIPQLCLKILEQPPPRVSGVRSDLPAGLEEVILRCMEKDPAQRYQHVGALADALSPFVTGRARMSAERVADVARTTGLASRATAATTSPEGAAPTSAPVSGAAYRLGSAEAGAAAQAPAALAAITGLPSSGPTPPAAITSASWTDSLTPRRRSPALLATAGIAVLALGGGLALALFVFPDRDGTSPEAEQPAASTTAAQPAPAAEPQPSGSTTTTTVEPAGPAETATASAATPPPPATSASAVAHPPPSVRKPLSGKPPGPGGGNLFDDRK